MLIVENQSQSAFTAYSTCSSGWFAGEETSASRNSTTAQKTFMLIFPAQAIALGASPSSTIAPAKLEHSKLQIPTNIDLRAKTGPNSQPR